MAKRQKSLFEDQRLGLEGAIDLSLASLREYGRRYPHWAICFSGGKDSSTVATFVPWAIDAGLVDAPESLTVLYGDTRQEIPPLQQTAMRLLSDLAHRGITTQVVTPALDDRYFVYMLGRGVPPPNNMTLRWCTPQLKIEPMQRALIDLRNQSGQKLLMLTGVRLGESAARDQRIALSCSRDTGECGQGWFQMSTPESIADTLAPILHWRLCHVWDWLYFERERHGFDVSTIATVYGEGDVRTGCIGCPLANEDTALKRLIRQPEYSHLSPLMELKPLYRELRKAKMRLRKTGPEKRKNGKFGIEDNLKPVKINLDVTADWEELKTQVKGLRIKKRKKRDTTQRLGPLTMEARAYGLARVLDIQARAGVDLINEGEESRIRELWALNTWPQRWTGDEVVGDQPIEAMRLGIDSEGVFIAVQGLLMG